MLERWVVETGDLGAVPERELVARGLVKDVLAQYEQRKQRPGRERRDRSAPAPSPQ